MAFPAQALKPVRVVGVLSRLALHRHDVIALKATGPAALATAPAVSLEDSPADSRPALAVHGNVVFAQRNLSTRIVMAQFKQRYACELVGSFMNSWAIAEAKLDKIIATDLEIGTMESWAISTTIPVSRVRTHYSHQMTAAARAIAAMKFLMLRSKRVAIRRQSLRRQNMRSMMLRCL